MSLTLWIQSADNSLCSDDCDSALNAGYTVSAIGMYFVYLFGEKLCFGDIFSFFMVGFYFQAQF